ncbi:peptidoglycan D,D-transpeptidase FtsI family protein [Paraburkholderia aspalathi]|uniref:Cell division protein FtsI (Penicillin-binding protein 3) n=1 Tax=Paraburkholderia aspalathi TaxID=1324617 RepID=A0A1I7EJI3_9BURK|nr:penicillin-binding protein 2 [Paraburkholderia aspalathi]SFU24091.1 cell division protein FtsI (penicillin-binding protein 3) [Paraburkholderia aspalathi]
MGAVFTLGFLVLAARAAWVQGINDEFYQKQGEARQVREFAIHASRGRILDRNGRPLALSLPTRTLWMDALGAKPLSDTQAKALASALNLDAARINAIAASRRSFAYLKRQVPLSVAQRALGLDVPGVYAQPGYRRYYPEGNIAAHVTGFTGIDGKGLEGIEKIDNRWLTGIDGSRRVLRNAHGQVIETLALVRPVAGKDVNLSIDQPIQYATFRALHDAVQRTDTQSGSAIVLDVHTGEILAMANWPSFDPNLLGKRTGEAIRNHAVTDVFEPGSVMKPITISLALQRNYVSPRSVVPTNGGRLRLDGVTIHDDKNFGTLTVSGVVQKSSNVGTSKIALLMQPRDMWSNFHAVGLGHPPRAGLPGAAGGTLRPYQHWRRVEQATMSYGYGLSASLLQLAQMYTVFGNKGVFVPATIAVRRDGSLLGKRVYSPHVAAQVLDMLESVVSEDGTAPQAAVPGYTAAGKTGTAYRWTAHGYDRSQYRASFVGIVPATQPRVVIAVSIDRPQHGSHFGGAVAGPVFSDIAAKTMSLLGVTPDNPERPFDHVESKPVT